MELKCRTVIKYMEIYENAAIEPEKTIRKAVIIISSDSGEKNEINYFITTLSSLLER